MLFQECKVYIRITDGMPSNPLAPEDVLTYSTDPDEMEAILLEDDPVIWKEINSVAEKVKIEESEGKSVVLSTNDKLVLTNKVSVEFKSIITDGSTQSLCDNLKGKKVDLLMLDMPYSGVVVFNIPFTAFIQIDSNDVNSGWNFKFEKEKANLLNTIRLIEFEEGN